jgi:hypothetical protein
LHRSQIPEQKRKEKELKSPEVKTTNRVETIISKEETTITRVEAKETVRIILVPVDKAETEPRDKVDRATVLQVRVDKVAETVLETTRAIVPQVRVAKTVLRDRVAETVLETTDRAREQCLLN